MIIPDKQKHLPPEQGAVMVEFILSLILLLTVVMAFAQQYVRSVDKLSHYSLANQVTFGPQLPTLSFNESSGEFERLQDTRPPLNLILNFLERMAADNKYSFYAGLGYLAIDPETGYIGTANTPSGFEIGNSSDLVHTTMPGATSPCNNDSLRRLALYEFMREKLKELRSLPGQSPDPGDEWRVGLKIYEFKLGDTRYRQYSEFYPYIFISICSNPVNIIYPQSTVTYHMISPRRLVN